MRRYGTARSLLLALAGLWLATAAPAWSQHARPTLTTQQLLLQRLQPAATLPKYQENLRTDFFTVDADGDGQITQRDVDLHTLMEGIQARMRGIAMAMRYDLDGDGFVTEDEIRRGMRYDQRVQIGIAAYNRMSGQQPNATVDFMATQIDNTVRTIMALDADKDGKVSVTEAAQFGGQNRQNFQAERARQLLALDIASKGALSLADYQAAGEALFRDIDTDKDGVVSQQELNDYRTRADRLGCEMPPASEKAKVVLLSSYETEALSSVTLDSQDSVIHAGRIVVEDGSDPLYVVIATYAPTIWQFSGAVERIERLVMTSMRTGPNSGDVNQPSLVGATGIAPERVSFLRKSNCLPYFNETPTSTSLQTVAAVRKAAGKAPEVVATRYSVTGFGVPSGNIESKRAKETGGLVIEKQMGMLKIIGNAANVIMQSGPSRAKDDLYRFAPGGVAEIDPKTVVSSQTATSYEVLPQQAGLVQLLASGALKQNSVGEYIVQQKIRFPAGLSGAHAVTFLVMKGTPYPDGDPGHSCVVLEESGEKKGATCR